ncbi:hypothetical protein LLH03_19580 [bacterium]|nr:hypothetical protein [bacterium]
MLTLALLIAASWAWAQPAPAPQSISFRTETEVVGEAATLGELATLEPPEAATGLASLVVAAALSPGQSRSLTAGYLRLRLRHAGLDLTSVQVTCPERVTVSRKAVAAPPTAETKARTTPAAQVPASQVLRPGARVTLLVRAGGLTVQTPGECMETCVALGTGRFRVIETRATVYARVLDATSAEVIR